jgi:hypothetical protein
VSVAKVSSVRLQLGAELRKLWRLAGLSQRHVVDEGSATLIRNHQLTWLPGLLQTADYARLISVMTQAGADVHAVT